MFGNNRQQMRQTWFDAWHKKNDKKILSALDNQICQIIEIHPEYHQLFNQPDKYLDQDFQGEDGTINPFLHLSMHLGLLEQLSTNRPLGVQQIYQKISEKSKDQHHAQHQMMDCLGFVLWQAQQDNKNPNDEQYLACLKKLL